MTPTQEIEEARRISAGLKPSRKWQAMRTESVDAQGVMVYVNNVYTVTVRRYSQGWPFGGGPWTQLGIYCIDGEARHDFRDFQCIKNDICGSRWEAIELYPSEERLTDPSNYYILFCAPNIGIGMHNGRQIMGPHNCLAPQRGWSPGSEPPELRRA